MLIKRIVTLLPFALIILGCNSASGELNIMLKDDLVEISVFLEAPFGQRQNFTKQEDMQEILKWLERGKAPDSPGSYPDALVEVRFRESSGKETTIRISQPLPSIGYTYIKYNGSSYVTGPYPDIIKFNSVSL